MAGKFETIWYQIAPFTESHKANCVLRTRRETVIKTSDAGVLDRIEDSRKIEKKHLSQYNDEMLSMKAAIEDKAKTSILGITIAITLIMGVADFLKTVAEKYDRLWIEWIVVVFLLMAIVYFFIAGLLSMWVLFEESIGYGISLESYTGTDEDMRMHIGKSIELNQMQNSIRNNCVYASYGCIRNAVVCLVLVLMIVIIPIEMPAHVDNELDQIKQYDVLFTEDAVSNLGENQSNYLVKGAVLNSIQQESGIALPDSSIGFIDYQLGVFIKYMVSENAIIVLKVEPYSAP